MQPEELPRQLRAIFDLLHVDHHTALEGDKPEKVLHWLYRILDTLDSKTSHLLRLNAIIFAAQAFLVNGIVSCNPPRYAVLASVVFLFVPFLGTIASMKVFRVAWPFLGWQTRNGPVITERQDVEVHMWREFAELARLCDGRTRMHKLVWWFTLISIILLAPSVLIRFLVI